MAYPDEINQIWEMVKESFRGECSTTTFDLWYGSITPESFDPEKFEILFKVDGGQFKKENLERSYKQRIEERFASVAGIEVSVSFYSDAAPADASSLIRRINGTVQSPAPPVETLSPDQQQRAKYTFDNFIEGDTNRFARAACWKVANNPSTVWNPLFIHGPSGVGKTHLMCAVINEMRRQKPDTKVIYTKGDDFINDMVRCLANSDMEGFRNRYRRCDVLLVDDIQFIAGKEATQTEVFHTFQALFDEGKQIILASDRPPKDINPLEERLRSRFEQGLLADIKTPDLELRTAIIKKKAEDLKIDLPYEVLSFLAENLRSNIRQIEGAIKKLEAKALIEGRNISLELARDCISDLLGDAEPLSVTIDKIFAAVFKKYNIPKEEVVGKKRNKEIAVARHVAVYLIREITEMSLPNIGKIFDRDHSTAMSSIDWVKKHVVTEPIFAADIENLKKEIQGR